ncbi:transmembrane protein 60 isoform X2 [Cotesia glomerata]|uniref:transmembrane protein 60 isoform X2 n=1 Tax=Cotesia glomerata TaxID=32391 RepID=UPI001D02C652|nr:transmembrane protein 60 isoform X2 [Cotesia glomerata]
MAVLHRALFTWFELLIFLILLVLRLDQRILWNWFIVFIPMWLYDTFLLIYIIFNMVSHCKNNHNSTNCLRRKGWHMLAVLLKLSVQILICLKLEAPYLYLPAKAVLSPFWVLLPALTIDVFFHLIQHSRY